MRQIIWVAAAAIGAMIVFRELRVRSLPAPPEDAWFQSAVVQPSLTRPVIVKFGAVWCGPCRRMDAQLDQLESRQTGRVLIVRIDVDERPSLAEHFGIGGIPDTFVFRNGRAVARETGYLDSSELERLAAHSSP